MDADSRTAIGYAFITVQPGVPTAVPHSYACNSDAAPCVYAANIGLLTNATTPNANGSLAVVVNAVQQPAVSGSVAVVANGSFTFTPAA